MWFWIAAAVTGGLVFTAVDRLAILLIPAGFLFLLFFPVLTALMWVNDHTLMTQLIIGSWKRLSGFDGHSILVKCKDVSFPTSNTHLFVAFGIYGVCVLFLVCTLLPTGLAALFLTPIGIIVAFIGAVWTLYKQDGGLMLMGIGMFAGGLVATLIAGIAMRIVHMLSAVAC